MSIHKLTESLLPGEADEDLVAALEDMTEKARRGEVTAVAWAATLANGSVSNGWQGAGGTLFSLGAGIMTLHTRYSAYMMDEDD